MIDWANYQPKNHIPFKIHCRSIRRKINLSWALAGRDVFVAIASGFVVGLLLGVALLVMTWR